MYDYVIIDLEMCNVNRKWMNNGTVLHKEIIQIGAVIVDSSYHIIDTFSTYVKPVHGKIDHIITDITGIRQNMVKKAPLLQEAIGKLSRWIGPRRVIFLSWSNTDYHQMIQEMKAKKIRNRKMFKMMERWTDFQKSFDEMLGTRRQISLYDALEMAQIRPAGKAHDGLCDAYNTARLFVKIKRQSRFVPNLVPIRKEKTETVLPSLDPWTLKRRIRGILYGKETVTDTAWKQYLFRSEMIRLSKHDRQKGVTEKILI